MIEITMGMALLQLTSQPSGVDYPEKKIIWPESNTGKAPTWEEVETKRQELINAEPMRILRVRRNNKLAETDWRFRSDLTPSQEWIDYCQALRDLPSTASPELDENGQLANVTWPTKPVGSSGSSGSAGSSGSSGSSGQVE